MKKWLMGFLLVFFSARPLQADGVTAFHVLRPGETLWFVAQIYYNDGNEYKKLLAANHLQKAEDVDIGLEISIPNPMWLETMPTFAEHYSKLFKQRSVALQKKAEKRAIARQKHNEKSNPTIVDRAVASEAEIEPKASPKK